MIARSFQTMLANKRDSELEFDDVTKIIGCWNGLVKRRTTTSELCLDWGRDGHFSSVVTES